MAVGWARAEAIQANTRMANESFVTNARPILLAQAAVETDGKVYYADVIQIDGTKKRIKYYRDPRWAIIAPPVDKDRKLVDGSVAPENPVAARVAQKKILVKYDKEAQLNLALVSKEDILRKASNTTGEILNILEQWKLITKEQLADWLYSAYIFNIAYWNGKADRAISSLESVAIIKMKLSEPEIAQIKRDAEVKARNIWKSVIGQ